MSKGKCVEINDHLIIMVSPVIRIMVVSVLASDASLNESDTNGGVTDTEFVLLLFIPHLVADRMTYFKILYMLSAKGWRSLPPPPFG